MKPKLKGEPWLVLLILVIAASVILAKMTAPEHPGREISLAAQACWDQGLRAILHNDGSIECRE